MVNLKIFCFTLKNLGLLNKLPKYIVPFGLGNGLYPKNWKQEKKYHPNILHLNSYYSDQSGLYCIWKHELKNYKKNNWIGICHYRKLWLDSLHKKKNFFSFSSINDKLLSSNNKIFLKYDSVLVQPIIFKSKKNLLEDFNLVHGENVLEKVISFLDKENREGFKNHVKNNVLYLANMFITKPKILRKYCKSLFPWLNKCFRYAKKEKLFTKKDNRLIGFLAERYCSYWFSNYTKFTILSYIRLGNFYISNKVNNILNPLKIPMTFSNRPTIHEF